MTVATDVHCLSTRNTQSSLHMYKLVVRNLLPNTVQAPAKLV